MDVSWWFARSSSCAILKSIAKNTSTQGETNGTQQPHPAGKEALLSFADNPDASHGILASYATESKLRDEGYVTYSPDSRGYILTDKGREYVDYINEHVNARDLTGLALPEREHLIDRLDVNDPKDAEAMLGIALHDKSGKLRDTAIHKLDRTGTLDEAEWNRLAREGRKEVRKAATHHADPALFANETDADVVYELIRNRDDISHETILAWLDSDNPDVRRYAARLADETDIPLMMRHKETQKEAIERFPERLYADHVGDMLTDPDMRLVLANDGTQLNDDTLRTLAADKKSVLHYRLSEYRSAYRQLMKLESELFADPQGAFADEQRQLAMQSDWE